MRLNSIIILLQNTNPQLRRCQCAHQDLDERVGPLERWGRLLSWNDQARYGIGQQAAEQRMRHRLDVDIGDQLLLPGSVQQSWQVLGWGQGRKRGGKARLLQRQMAQDIDKEVLFTGIVAVEGLSGGN